MFMPAKITKKLQLWLVLPITNLFEGLFKSIFCVSYKAL